MRHLLKVAIENPERARMHLIPQLVLLVIHRRQSADRLQSVPSHLTGDDLGH